MQPEDDEIYSTFKSSPLLTEATKVIVEAEGPIGLREVAEKLGKKPPTVHRALRKLRDSKILLASKSGRNVAYSILPAKKLVVERILSKLYHPTDSYVLGMLKRHDGIRDVAWFENIEVIGRCFPHVTPLVYERVSSSNSGKTKPKLVGVDVLSTLSDEDMLGLAGRLFDLASSLHGYVLAVIENGVLAEEYQKLQEFIKTVKPKLNFMVSCVFIRKDDPIDGIQEVRRAVAGMLR
jgi:DNA-binding Lrp family transcriptional regulator